MIPSGKTILVVEDDNEVRELVGLQLARLGYRSIAAANAREAARLFEEHPTINVLLTDVTMPGVSGVELTKKLTASRPDLKVVFMSGDCEDVISQYAAHHGGAFLAKPFTSQTLDQKIRDVLSSK